MSTEAPTGQPFSQRSNPILQKRPDNSWPLFWIYLVFAGIFAVAISSIVWFMKFSSFLKSRSTKIASDSQAISQSVELRE
jgi:hypothetical protein